MFKYCLFIQDKETHNDIIEYTHAISKIIAMLNFRKDFKWTLIEFEDQELLDNISQVG